MQRYVQSRMTRSLRDARPAVPRPLPRRHRGRSWPRVVSSLLLVGALAAALLDTAPLLIGRAPGAPDLGTLLAAPHGIGVWLDARRTSPPAALPGTRLAVAAGGQSWPVTPADLALMLRPVPAGSHGRDKADVVDRAAVAAYVGRRAAALDRPGRDATVRYDGGVARFYQGRDGQVVDREAATERLVAALRGRNPRVMTTITWPLVSGPTVTNAEARRLADQLRRTLRTTVVWLPRRHWAIPPARIAAALTVERVPTRADMRLVARLDPTAIAARLPGSWRLAYVPAQAATVAVRGGRMVRVPAVTGRYPNYAALAAEMLRSPPGRAVYHLPITSYDAR